jgi:predicted DNA-binding transcriptional regulator AlpA
MLLPTENLDRLLTPQKALDYMEQRYDIIIKLSSFYSMINRGEAPTPKYFRNRPKFTKAAIDEWVRTNLSDHR